MLYMEPSAEKALPGPLRTKLSRYTIPDEMKMAGLYPYFRVIESDQDTRVTIGGKPVLMFGSNSYLGLTNHPAVIAAARGAISRYGSGCAGSRFLNGNLDLHLQLEEELARFTGKEASLVFSTGFQVNIGVIPALLGRNDYLILDELDHVANAGGTLVEALHCGIGATSLFDGLLGYGSRLRHLTADFGDRAGQLL